MKKSDVLQKFLTHFYILTVINLGFYAGAAFAPLEPFPCPEDLGFVPVLENELGTGAFCVDSTPRTSSAPFLQSQEAEPSCNIEEGPCENGPSYNPSELVSALPPEEVSYHITLKEAVQDCRHLNEVFAEQIEGTGTEFDLITKSQWNALKENITLQGRNVRGPYVVLSDETTFYINDSLWEWVKEDSPIYPNQASFSEGAFLSDESMTGADESTPPAGFSPAVSVGFRCVLHVMENQEALAQTTEETPVETEEVKGQLAHILRDGFLEEGASMDSRFRGNDWAPAYEGVTNSSASPYSSQASSSPSVFDQILSLGESNNGNNGNDGGNSANDNNNRRRSTPGLKSNIGIRSSHVASITAVYSTSSMIDPAEFQVTLSPAATASTTVSVSLTQASSWFNTSDLTQSVTFAVGDTTKTISLDPKANFPNGSKPSLTNGNLVATIQSGTGYTISATASSATARIVSVFPNVKIRMTRSSYQFDEDGGGHNLFTLEARTEPGVPKPRSRVKFLFTTSPDTATQGIDYFDTIDTGYFQPADFVQSGSRFVARLTSPLSLIRDDNLPEGPERFFLRLNRNQSEDFIQVGNSSWKTCVDIDRDAGNTINLNCHYDTPITINDEEDSPVASITAVYSTSSMIDPAEFQVTLSTAATASTTVSVSLTQASSWFNTSDLTQSVTFAVGDTTKTISLDPKANFPNGSKPSLTNGNLVATIQSGTGYTISATASSATARIVSVFPNIKMRMTSSSYQFDEDGGIQRSFTFEARTEPGVPKPRSRIQFRFSTLPDTATSGTDYRPTDEPYYFEPSYFVQSGSRFVAHVTITFSLIYDDNLPEGPERFFLRLHRNQPEDFIQVGNSSWKTCVDIDRDAGNTINLNCHYDTPITINDEEDSTAPPVEIKVRVTQASYEVEEGRIKVITLEARTESGVPKPSSSFGIETYLYADTAGSEDFSARGETITFSPGNFKSSGGRFIARKTFVAQTLEDHIVEGPETLIFFYEKVDTTLTAIQMANSSWKTCVEDQIEAGHPIGLNCLGSAVITITDDDTRGVRISPTTFELESEEETATYDVSLASEPTGNVTITPSVAGGGSVSPASLTFTSDNWSTAQTVTFTAGSESAIITHSVSGADYGDNNITAPSVTAILDDIDSPTRVNIRRVTSRAEEGEDLVFKVRLSRVAREEIRVSWRTANHTDATHPATAGEDYPVKNEVLVFGAGEQEKTVRITSTEDNRVEQDETFKVELYNYPSQVTPGALMSEVFTIEDDGDKVTVGFAESSYTVGEGDGAVTVTIRLDEAAEREISLTLNTSNGTARWVDDFEQIPATGRPLSFLPGEREKTFSLDIVDDNDLENKEDFRINIQGYNDNTTNLETRNTTIYIEDNEPPTLTVGAAKNVEGSPIKFPLTLSHPRAYPITGFAFTSIKAGEDTASTVDFTPRYALYTFAPGETTKIISVPTTSDNTDEEDETFTLNVTVQSLKATFPNGGTAKGTIIDRTGLPVFSIVDLGTTFIEGEATGGFIRGRVGPLSSISETLTVTVIAPEGLIFKNGRNTFTFDSTSTADGDGFLSVSLVEVQVVDDDIVNGTRTFDLTATTSDAIAVPTGTLATITVTDDETPATLSVSAASAVEGSPVVFTVTLNEAQSSEVSVRYSTRIVFPDTVDISDYFDTQGTLTFAPGETTKTVSVRTKTDNRDENDETFTFGLERAQGATITTSTVLGTIIDRTGLPVASLSQNISTPIPENNGHAVSIRAYLRIASNTALGTNITLNISASEGAALSGNTYSFSADAVSDSHGRLFSTTVRELTAVNDDIYNGDRTVEVAIQANTSVVLAPSSTLSFTVTDDEDIPILSFGKNRYTISENDDEGAFEVDVSLNRASAERIVAFYQTHAATATPGEDYVAQDGKVVFEPGETEKTIRVPIIDDDVLEGAEGFSIDFYKQEGDVSIGAEELAALEILNDDVIVATIGPDLTILEGEEALVKVSLSHPTQTPFPLRVSYADNPGSATPGTDFNLISNTSPGQSFLTTFNTGDFEKYLTVQAVEDDLDELSENLQLDLTIGTGQLFINEFVSIGKDQAIITIRDNDTRGVGINPTTLYVYDPGDTDTYKVALTSKPTGDVVVTPSLSGGGTGPTLSPASLTFTPDNWASARTVTFTAGQNPDGADATITHSVTGADYGENSVTAPTVTAKADDPDLPPRVRLKKTSIDAPEGEEFEITILLSRPAENRIRIPYAMREGTAGNSDVNFTLEELRWIQFEVGEREKSARHEIKDDTLVEETETFTILIPEKDSSDYVIPPSAANLYTMGNVTTGTVDVIDNDEANYSLVPDSLEVAEESGMAHFTVRLDNQVAYPFRLGVVTVPGSALEVHDYNPQPEDSGLKLVAFEPNELEKRFSIPLTDDDEVEENEQFKVQLRGNNSLPEAIQGVEGETEKTITILSEDVRSVIITPLTIEMEEGESATYEIKVTSGLGADTAIQISPTLSGSETVVLEGLTVAPTYSYWILQGFGPRLAGPPFTVTVQAQQDDDDQDEEIVITHEVRGRPTHHYIAHNVQVPTVRVHVYDDEGRGIRPISGTLRGEGLSDYHSGLDGATIGLGRSNAEGLWLTEGWSQEFLVKVPRALDQAQEVEINVSGTVNSADYSLEVGGSQLRVPHRITIPAGEREARVTLKIKKDGNDSEGTETLTLSALHNGQPLGVRSYTYNISPCGGSDPKAFAWLSVDGEDPLRRHNHTFNANDQVQGPLFRLRLCFREAMQSPGIGGSGALGVISPDSYRSVLDRLGIRGANAVLSNLSQRAAGHVWTADVQALNSGMLAFSLNFHRMRYSDGSHVESAWQSMEWDPIVNVPGDSDPLTATFSSAPPTSHDGSTPFRFSVIFSDPVPLSPSDMINFAAEITGGTFNYTDSEDNLLVTRTDNNRLWSFEVTPNGVEDITINFPAPSDCGEWRSAICTGDGRALVSAISSTISGPDEGPSGGELLTAHFSDAPAEHDSINSFSFKLNFSDPVTASSSVLKNQALRANFGRIESVSKVDGRSDLWKVKVKPTGTYHYEAVTITLSAPYSCEEDGAICTSDNRPLSNSPTLVVMGPAVVSIADATAREGVDSTIDFALTLSRPASKDVSISWITKDITATEGADYKGGHGTISFATGEQNKTLSLRVYDDGVDEGEETFKVTLFKETGLRADQNNNRAIGTITNDDPMPRAWLARFGRTVGSQAVEAISSRMGASSEENKVVIGGVDVSSGEKFTEESLEDKIRRERFKSGAFSWKDGEPEQSREMTMEELVQGTSFYWRSQSEEPGGNAWSAWGQVLTGNFSGSEDDVNLEGEVTSGFFGMDLTSGKWKGGLALSQSEGKGTFDLLDSGTVEDQGKVKSSLTSLYPYLGYEWSENKALWGILGFGEGDMTLTQLADEERETDTVTETDISMKMGAVGAKSPLMSQSEGDRVDVVIQTDAMYIRMNSEASKGMESAEADVTRLRLMIDSSRTFEIGSGVLTPSIQTGVRHDGGDAEKGLGLEAGGTLRYEAGGVTLEGSVRKLLAHEDSDYEEWGASAALRIDPGESGRGLNLSIAPTWGEPSSGIDNLWSAEGAHQFGNGEFEPENRLEAEIGYGIRNPLKKLFGILTPYFGLSLGDSNRVHRTGTRWTISPNANLGLELSRTKGESKEDDDKAIMLQGGFQW